MKPMTSSRLRRISVCLLAAWFALSASLASAQAETQRETKRDVSPPINEAKKKLERAEFKGFAEKSPIKKEHRVRTLPLPKKKKGAPSPASAAPTAKPFKLSASIKTQFDGIGKGPKGSGADYLIQHAPPDTNGSVSEIHYVQWVNQAFAVFDKKTGKPLAGPTDGNALWLNFGGKCEGANDGDPIVLYDKLAKRWLMTQFAVTGGPPFSQCIAVSQTPDPLSKYFRYEFQFRDFNDYPKFGVWPDGYYAAFNMFRDDSFLGAKVCAFERDKMLAGQAATMQCFDIPDQAGLLPSDLDGANPPPAGSPNYFLNFGDNELNLWKLKVDWQNAANTKFTGPLATQVAAFEPACGNTDCIVQPGTKQRLQPLSDRLMYRLAYRNLGVREVLTVNHTVKAGMSTGIRWYELHNPRGTLQVKQQGTYTPDGAFRWKASIAMDKAGNMLMGYSVSDASVSPSIRYAGRSASDPLNAMSLEQTVVTGKGAQLQNLDRWGDYSSISLDPSDDCTFWFTSQYSNERGTFDWYTSISSLKFQNCM